MKSKASKNPIKLILYTKPGCHLCDRARAMIAAIDPLLVFEEIDISTDEKTTVSHGERIPVLQRSDSGAELDWPFDTELAKQFLRSTE